MANNKNHFDRKPEYWESMHRGRRKLFSITTLIGPLVVIGIVLLLYYYLIIVQNFFPAWQTYLYWAMKIIIAFEILTMCARSLWGPILTLLVSIGFIVAEKLYDLPIFTMADGWQLLTLALIGFLVTLVVKL